MIIRPKLSTIVALVVATLIAGPAWAQFTPRIALDVSGNGAAVMINGRPAVRFYATNGNLSATERASITAERIRNLAASKVNVNSIQAKGDRSQGRVYAGETMVCIATAADAKAASSTPLTLAQVWARNIRTLLAMPPVSLGTQSVMVPLGENRRVEVGGAATGPIYAKSETPEVAAASAGIDGRYIQVTGQQVGNTTIEVSVDGERAVLKVLVRKYAGSVPLVSFAEVTGSPCPSSLVKYAATQAVLREAVLEPGTKISIEKFQGAESALGSGLKRDARVAAKIVGEGYIPYSAEALVQVHNSAVPRDEARELFYSNAPERLLKYQTLFASKLTPGKSARLLYHHQNAMGKRAHFVVEIINPSPLPATFRIYRGISGPLVDTVLVGYIASLAFLKDQQANASVIERVPPRSRLVLVSDKLDHLITASGILQIKQTDGQEAYVRVAALPPGLDEVAVGGIAPAGETLAMEMSDQVYPSPVKNLEADYVVGQRWAFISIGRHALTDNSEQNKLHGNYGVTYDIKVKVENPTDQTKKVSVVFDPTAGLASGVFVIDGEFVSTKYAKPPTEFTLASYQMKPGEVRNVRIVTVPVAGSNYPAMLVVRS